jgi:hypothetical protein
MEKFELKEIIIFEGITKVAWGPNAKAVGFSGSVVHSIFDKIAFDFVFFRDAAGKNALSMGASFPFYGLVTLINNFFEVPGLIDVVNSFYGSDIAVIFSYNDIDFTFISEFRPSYTAFLDYFNEKFQTGLTVYSEIRFANDRLEIARYLRRLFGENSYLLKINLQLTSFSAGISVTDVDLGGGFFLSEVGIYFTASLTTTLQFEIRGKLSLPSLPNDKRNVTLFGSISLTPLVAKMSRALEGRPGCRALKHRWSRLRRISFLHGSSNRSSPCRTNWCRKRLLL